MNGFFEQTFALPDLFKVFTLTFLELALSADNAIVLGVLIHTLNENLRQKALYIGAISAIVLRFLAVLSASFLLRYFWIQLIGAAYLLYLSANYFVKRKSTQKTPKKMGSFWKTMLVIEFLDLIFAIDSIVAGVAFVGPSQAAIHPKLWIVYFGGTIGLLVTRYAAHLFSSFIDRFPRLGTSAHLLIGWVGVELAINSLPWTIPYFTPIFWVGVTILLGYGFSCEKRSNNK